MQNYKIDNLVSIQQNNLKLMNALELIKPRKTLGSLAAYDGFNTEELLQFRRSFCHELGETVTGSEMFPGEMLSPINNQVDLPEDVFKWLITYYNEAYDEMNVEFISITDLLERGLQNDSSNRYSIVQPIINQCGRVRIAAEIFSSVLSPRHKKNSYILAMFTQNDNSVDLFPGQVQFYFEHTLRFPTGISKAHRLAYVKWYLPVDDHRIRFYCRIEKDDRSVNIELWDNTEFFDLSRDRIIPIHNIYSRFVPANFVIGKKKSSSKSYMAVIPINRQFHL
jgi:hypothetical protein